MQTKDIIAQGIISLYVAGTYFGISLLLAPATRFTIAISILIGVVSFFSGLYYTKRSREREKRGDGSITGNRHS